MKRHVASVVILTAVVVLSGCAYKPLEAPCRPDEGYHSLAFAPALIPEVAPTPFRALDPCGPIKPI